MDKIFMFDIDGTLTPSRLRMTKEFSKFFDEWSSEGIFKNSFAYPEIKRELVRKNKYYLVTGSDLDKTKEQLPIAYIDRAEAIFTCCGNQMWIDDELIYDNKFKVPRKLNKLLGTIMSNSQYPHRYGNHIEDRGSMVNFSIVGRDCTQEQREEYFEWDKQSLEREIIANAIKEKFSDLDAVLGGQISIDIYPKGHDKSQIFKHITDNIIKKIHPDIYNVDTEFIFVGDRTEKGGNDYPLAKLMKKTQNCKYHQVEDYRKTWWLLQRYELGLENK